MILLPRFVILGLKVFLKPKETKIWPNWNQNLAPTQLKHSKQKNVQKFTNDQIPLTFHEEHSIRVMSKSAIVKSFKQKRVPLMRHIVQLSKKSQLYEF